ncbi:DUF916 domain-containing protein [Rhodococcus sp. ARC_M6]|uniref:DUF916 domain-containing protein n=1 Tax=Rhodococcus sp. ARC_M6 TaxID=2928852 RepID=UPI001FB4EC7E|nr:DUF916 domain-containing protein [Rhodococcus sp. ARC_M6]MCJ0901924.1 DUF916 domain-containing protein [Rhodococcus sp. ARC_M6]
MRTVLTALCVLVLTMLSSTDGTAQTLPGQPGIEVQLLDIPTATQQDPRARAYIVDHLPPGTVINRRIQIRNNSDSPQSVRIYTGAAHIDNGIFVGDNDPSMNELTTWTSVDQSTIDLPPRGAAEAVVTIDVPKDAAEGEQYGAVWAEIRSAAAQGSNIVQASRAGIRIYLSVGAGNGTPADFAITSLTTSRDDHGKPQVSALVTNIGGRAVDITGELTLTKGPGGLSAGPFTPQQGATIAPGGTGTIVTTMARELPNGPWTAQLRLKSGLLERSTEAPITFPDAGMGETVEPHKSNVLKIALGTAALLVIAAAVLWWLRRRTKQQS